MKSKQNHKFAIASSVQKRLAQAIVGLCSLTLFLGLTTTPEISLNTQPVFAIHQLQADTLIAYEKDWKKDLERKEKTVEKHGESMRKYVEQAQQYNAANPNSKIDKPSTVGRQVKSPRAKRQRKHQNFFQKLFQSDSDQK